MRITGTVRTGLGFFAAIVGIFGSFGCGSSSSGTEAPVDLASGGVEVYTAPSYSSSAQSVTRINIVDAVQDDKRIIALLATGATTREFAQNNQALAGRAAVLLFQDISRKVFPKRAPSSNSSNPMDRFSLDVGTVDPRSGRQELMGRFKLSSEYQIGAGVDMQGDMRMELQYLLRFR